MHTLCRKSVEVNSQCSRQRLTLTGSHFSDLAIVKHHGADKLHIKVTHTEHATASLTHNGKGFRQKRIKRLPLIQSFAKFCCFSAQLLIGKSLHFRFELIDLNAALSVLTNQAIIAAAENLGKKRIKHISTG